VRHRPTWLESEPTRRRATPRRAAPPLSATLRTRLPIKLAKIPALATDGFGRALGALPGVRRRARARCRRSRAPPALRCPVAGNATARPRLERAMRSQHHLGRRPAPRRAALVRLLSLPLPLPLLPRRLRCDW
jgi:hypothetical protein